MKKVRIQSFKESIRKTFTVYALIPSLVFTIVAFQIFYHIRTPVIQKPFQREGLTLYFIEKKSSAF